MLTTSDHSRDAAGLRYVYPVMSRRAGGVSVGINLNPDNACNWRCIYCQVPDLRRGGPPPLDLALLETELDGFLHRAVRDDFLRRIAPPAAQRIVDIAFSGNGEPTSAPEFGAALEVVAAARVRHGLGSDVKIRLITNGSLVGRTRVNEALARLGELGGEAWFKVDAATAREIRRINGVRLDPDVVRRRLQACSGLVVTWVQTCVFARNGMPPGDEEIAAYLGFLGSVKETVAGVLLYGLARPSLQPDAAALGRLPADWLERLARRIEKETRLAVRVSP